MACLESSFYQNRRAQQISSMDGALDCVDEELLRLYVACVDTDRCQRTQQLLHERCELDWFGVYLQGVGRVMTFLQSELPVTYHECSRAERVPHICRRLRKRPPLDGPAGGDDAALATDLLALGLRTPPGRSRHSSVSAGSDSTFSLCSSFDSTQMEEQDAGLRLLRLSGALAFDGPWADRDTVDDGTTTILRTPPKAKWRRKMRLSLAYTCSPFKIQKIYYEENSKARRSLNFS